jgi:hypothetical protein
MLANFETPSRVKMLKVWDDAVHSIVSARRRADLGRTLQQRAAFRDHVMIPFEELRGRLLDQ